MRIHKTTLALWGWPEDKRPGIGASGPGAVWRVECYQRRRSTRDYMAKLRSTEEGRKKCRAVHAKWAASPWGKAKLKAINDSKRKTPEQIAATRSKRRADSIARMASPEFKQKRRQYEEARKLKPGYAERKRALDAIRHARPEVKAKVRAVRLSRNPTPEWKAINAERSSRWRALQRSVSVGDATAISTWWTRIRKSKRVRCDDCLNVFSGKAVEMDHVQPLSKGGLHSIENLRALCVSCNRKKSAKLHREANATLVNPRLAL